MILLFNWHIQISRFDIYTSTCSWTLTFICLKYFSWEAIFFNIPVFSLGYLWNSMHVESKFNLTSKIDFKVTMSSCVDYFFHELVTTEKTRSVIAFAPGRLNENSTIRAKSKYRTLLSSKCLNNSTQRRSVDTLFVFHSFSFSSVNNNQKFWWYKQWR